ncbi:hypothetical protein GPX89_25475 [Nocardia sp. ET3-3]|uniref:Uncharacterized protein n=1 Tax=Nocardia terrae TaxID=2675851 RepID=A0A7K1V380_9NOCA|nr:hypothetical protein [Nocardia terrae]MVU80588.1 hypothetical protein [Nocardia terrae]
MTAGQGARIALETAITLAFCGAVTVLAPPGVSAGSCGAALGDYRGEFTATEDSSNVLSFDGEGGIAFRSTGLGNGEGTYAVIPTGGFSATLRMREGGAGTSMVKSVTFACPAPGTQVASFNSLDQDGRRFSYVRSN